MLWDAHIHTKFSGDSESDPVEILQHAQSGGLTGVTFTDHHDIDYPKQEYEPPFLIPFEEYFPTLQALPAILPIHIGIELGLQPHVAEENLAVTTAHPFDFVIGSIHNVSGMDPYYGDFFENKTKREAYEIYFSETLENIQLFKDFDVLGHLDYIIRYYPGEDKLYRYADYADRIDAILTELIDSGRGLELNTGSLRRGFKEAHPITEVLERYRALGGDIITIGSDAHVATDVGADFAKGREILLSAGFTHYCIFAQRQPQFFPL